MLMKNGLGDLWMPCVCFLGLLASLGFGLHKVKLLCLLTSITMPCIRKGLEQTLDARLVLSSMLCTLGGVFSAVL